MATISHDTNEHEFAENDGSTDFTTGIFTPHMTTTGTQSQALHRRRMERLHSDPGATVPLLDAARHQNLDGRFEGSFGASGRPQAVHRVRWFRRKEYFTVGWTDPSIFRAATVELFGTCFSIYLAGQFGMTLLNNSVPVTAYVFFWNSVLLAAFIYATAPGSGGHINPAITFCLFIAGLCPLPRGVYYIIAQCIGGALAGGILRGIWGYERSIAAMGGGNFFNPATISPGSVLLMETVSMAAILYLAVGLGIDPRQQTLFGPYLGPALVGIAFGMWAAATTNIAPGCTGANGNPARALALAIAGDHWEYHWIWWLGAFLGAIILGGMYNLIPPNHDADAKEAEQAKKAAAQSQA